MCVCVCSGKLCKQIRSDKCCISHCLLDIISPVQLDTLQTGFQGSTTRLESHNTLEELLPLNYNLEIKDSSKICILSGLRNRK